MAMHKERERKRERRMEDEEGVSMIYDPFEEVWGGMSVKYLFDEHGEGEAKGRAKFSTQIYCDLPPNGQTKVSPAVQTKQRYAQLGLTFQSANVSLYELQGCACRHG
jgi:hypothetical protein